MAVDFAGLLDRKYANLEANTASEANLRGAQADVARGSLASENALRQAQAFSTTQTGLTTRPLADASIAATSAGIGQTNAQTGLIGAQTGLVGAQTGETLFGQSQAADESLGNYHDQALYGPNFGLGAGFAPNNFGSSPGHSADRIDPNDYRNKIRPTAGFAAGTPSVPPAKGKDPMNGQKAPMKGAKAPSQPQAAAGPPMAMPGGPMNLHAVMAHAIGALHAAGGMSNVPAPGQTITNGSWEGPTNQPAPAPAPAPAPQPVTPRPFGRRGVSAAGGATTVPQPAPAPAGPAPGQTITNGTWGSPTPNQDLRKQMGMGVKAAGGATDVYGDAFAHYAGGTVNAKAGKTTVPGEGPPNVDSVDAKLAPKEAVLNEGAANHLGRGTIAALNALGAAKMTQQGMPPETPPSAHGFPAPARGAPPKAASKAPARGMPVGKGKAPPPKAKVAAGAKGK